MQHNDLDTIDNPVTGTRNNGFITHTHTHIYRQTQTHTQKAKSTWARKRSGWTQKTFFFFFKYLRKQRRHRTGDHKGRSTPATIVIPAAQPLTRLHRASYQGTGNKNSLEYRIQGIQPNLRWKSQVPLPVITRSGCSCPQYSVDWNESQLRPVTSGESGCHAPWWTKT